MHGPFGGRKKGIFAIVIALFHFNILNVVVFNPVPEKARFINDYAVVTMVREGAVNTALACILFFGDIFSFLVEK